MPLHMSSTVKHSDWAAACQNLSTGNKALVSLTAHHYYLHIGGLWSLVLPLNSLTHHSFLAPMRVILFALCTHLEGQLLEATDRHTSQPSSMIQEGVKCSDDQSA